jgi:hypothetical protein
MRHSLRVGPQVVRAVLTVLLSAAKDKFPVRAVRRSLAETMKKLALILGLAAAVSADWT